MGNRRYMHVIKEAQPVFCLKGLSQSQQKILACEVMQQVGKRRGRFFLVNANPVIPPTLLSAEMTVKLVLETLKRGSIVLLEKSKALKRGRSQCVIECETAPQRTLFGTEILRNKRFKASTPRDEE